MSLYTFVFSYNNQLVNVRQTQGETLEDAVAGWATSLADFPLGAAKEKFNVKDAVAEMKAVPVKGMKNVFCTFFQLGRYNAVVYITKTEE